MNIVQVPQAAQTQPQINAGGISFVDYRDQGGVFRSRVLFDHYAFSFVQNGEKQIFRSTESTVLHAGEGMLIPEGNSIIAEHSNNAEPYHSVLIFFPGQVGRDFVSKHLSLNTPVKQMLPYLHFNTDAYISAYVDQLRQLIKSQLPLSEKMARHKLYELLLAMAELYPEQLCALFAGGEQLSLKSLIEYHLFNMLSLDELAFLANRSLSSFKRDFEKAYGISPQRYIRGRRLELACTELARGKSPSDLYLQYGYENLSNFNTAFKRKYGLPPAAYTQSHN